MHTQLQIGEIARLLGITPKTIRHYHRVGLLAEPSRSDSGYRLYSASDLLRVQRIRRLQALGLSLKQIKHLLGNATNSATAQDDTLRGILQALSDDLSHQIADLEMRRERIQQLLAAERLDMLDVPETSQDSQDSPTVAIVKAQLGEHLADISPELWEQEMRIDAQLDALNWPPAYNERVKAFVQYLAEHPHLYQQMLALGESLSSLASAPEDSPLIEQLAEQISGAEETQAFITELLTVSENMPGLTTPFAEVMADIVVDALSPAQRHFLELVSRQQQEQ